ncbi:MAG: ATP synthase F1 subunit delta [candidate division KSB1 bacterium]|nr:ATP synthase F1 subunit delta [candidate division KSB1 bacterium]MDZ7302649.1 ATP synthase F1 subunit delta [candidate division KSB1 bacterium]MDZ7311512.1 ATP synthase F1 subunit delta [candidate division KSB1 bacterium]
MKDRILARRYAKALFALAQERNILDKIRSELHGFGAMLEENAEFAEFFRSPENSRIVKREAIERLFQDRYSDTFFNFLLLIIQKGRHDVFPEIVLAFDELYDRYQRRTRVLAITAVPMDSGLADDLRDRLSKSLNMQIDLENRVDPAILGGIVLNIDGKVLDGSLKQHLERLRAEFLQSRTD